MNLSDRARISGRRGTISARYAKIRSIGEWARLLHRRRDFVARGVHHFGFRAGGDHRNGYLQKADRWRDAGERLCHAGRDDDDLTFDEALGARASDKNPFAVRDINNRRPLLRVERTRLITVHAGHANLRHIDEHAALRECRVDLVTVYMDGTGLSGGGR